MSGRVLPQRCRYHGSLQRESSRFQARTFASSFRHRSHYVGADALYRSGFRLPLGLGRLNSFPESIKYLWESRGSNTSSPLRTFLTTRLYSGAMPPERSENLLLRRLIGRGLPMAPGLVGLGTWGL
ncbi:hypothetical protein GWK47_027050 [Chionoecetes opilio]|uniref:Uncharacterized protein n=1 Tax=Chionoecetes opilio TaxID=41210 RepID=A0A8J8WCZ1_CHIOP|nr:hypothetical protein GWK47_027050 [Chionoecetes opilio]